MPLEIPGQFVDVDFDHESERLQLGTGNVGMGLFGAPPPVFEDSIDLIPESQWKDLIGQMDAQGGGCERLITRIYDQRQEGSCVSNATSQSHEICQAIQYGKDNVTHLSAISLYKRCGSSPGSGSTVSGNLSEMNDEGILPLDTPENRAKYQHVMPNTGFYQPYPDGWKETAKLFRGAEWYDIRTSDGLISALLKGWPVVVGRQGHSICYCRPAYRNNSLGVVYANSWGNWGFGAGDFTSGFGFDSWSLVRQSSGWAFGLRAVKVSQPIPNPPSN